MSDLVGNSEDRFSRVAAHMVYDKTDFCLYLHIYCPYLNCFSSKLKKLLKKKVDKAADKVKTAADQGAYTECQISFQMRKPTILVTEAS